MLGTTSPPHRRAADSTASRSCSPSAASPAPVLLLVSMAPGGILRAEIGMTRQIGLGQHENLRTPGCRRMRLDRSLRGRVASRHSSRTSAWRCCSPAAAWAGLLDAGRRENPRPGCPPCRSIGNARRPGRVRRRGSRGWCRAGRKPTPGPARAKALKRLLLPLFGGPASTTRTDSAVSCRESICSIRPAIAAAASSSRTRQLARRQRRHVFLGEIEPGLQVGQQVQQPVAQPMERRRPGRRQAGSGRRAVAGRRRRR